MEKNPQDICLEEFKGNYEIQNSDLIDLWKYFEDQGAKVKERMNTITTWLLAFTTGIISYIMSELKQFSNYIQMPDFIITILLCLIIFIIVGYIST